jgi:uncharacterized protein (TIGR02145 family)
VNGDSGATIQYSLDGGTTWLAYSSAVTLTNQGSYTISARQRSDTAGNWSVNATYITVMINQATDTTAPTVSVIPATITSSGFAIVQSTETGTAYLVNTSVTVSNRTSIENAAADNMSKSVVISAANTNTNLEATGLVEGTYKAYAVDAAENLSGASVDNVTIVGLVDIDGNVYNSVVIGSQTWMNRNLNVTKYKDGSTIPNPSGYVGSLSTGAYGDYNNSAIHSDTYGKLYNWFVVGDSRGICPDGWHVPTSTEFTVLTNELGVDTAIKMKEAGPDHWYSNTNATNDSGFTALPAGYRSGGSYNGLRSFAYFWSSTTTTNSSSADFFELRTDDTVYRRTLSKTYGFSIRCLED